MESVVKELDRLSKSEGFSKCEAQIDRLLHSLKLARSSIASGMSFKSPSLNRKLANPTPPDPSSAKLHVENLTSQLQDVAKHVTQAERDIYAGISKFSRSLDKVIYVHNFEEPFTDPLDIP